MLLRTGLVVCGRVEQTIHSTFVKASRDGRRISCPQNCDGLATRCRLRGLAVGVLFNPDGNSLAERLQGRDAIGSRKMDRSGPAFHSWPSAALVAQAKALPERTLFSTGTGPVSVSDLRRLLPHWRISEEFPVAVRSVDFVVIGRDNFDTTAVIDALIHGHAKTRILSQEAFLDWIASGQDWWDDEKKLKAAVASHQGLRTAKVITIALELPVRWPFVGSSDSVKWSTGELAAESDLKKNGYDPEASEGVRQSAIDETAKAHGIKYVMKVLAFQLNTKVNASPTIRMSWEDDLEWIKRNHAVEPEWPGRGKRGR